MPKLSYAQEVAALEDTVAAARSAADRLPPLALKVAGQLEAQIATLKALKKQQRAYVAEQKLTTEALHAAIARGTVDARYIRAVVLLVYGPKSGRITQFGLRIRRRPRPATREAFAVPRDAEWTTHDARANSADDGTDVQAVGADIGRVGEEIGQVGGNTSDRWGNPFDLRGSSEPIGTFPDRVGAEPARDGGNARGLWGKASSAGGHPLPNAA